MPSACLVATVAPNWGGTDPSRAPSLIMAERGIEIERCVSAGWRVQNHPQNVVATSPRGDALIDLHAAGPAQGAPADVRKDVNLPSARPSRRAAARCRRGTPI